MITICTTRPFTVRVQTPFPAPWPKLCPNLGECDSPNKEILMPGVVPRAQGGQRRPGAVGGAAAPASTVPPASPYTGGQEIEVAVEDVGSGGWCVAKPEGLPVLFVRHALPGERVV